MSSPTVMFISHASDPDHDNITYQWRIQDGAHSEQQTFIHTFQTPGNYYARLTVADAYGATSTRTISVSINASLHQPLQP